jgi:hydrogenase assembly chaperone HypC/HupF
MCLGIPGKVVEISDAGNALGIVDVSGVRREINLLCVASESEPLETLVGAWVLVHVGFAMSRIAGRSESMPDQELEGLYPFLHGRKQDPEALNAALAESVRQKAEHHQDVFNSFFNKNQQAIVDAAAAIADVYRGNGRLFVMGNGGSSCDSAHIAVEFLHPVTAGRPGLRLHNDNGRWQ